jgi:hypothetical protein
VPIFFCAISFGILIPFGSRASDVDTIPQVKLGNCIEINSDSIFKQTLVSFQKRVSSKFRIDSTHTSLQNYFSDSSLHSQINKYLSVISNDTNNLAEALRKRFFSFAGGNIIYNLNYRTGSDTPFVEKEILQNVASGEAGFVLGNLVPVRASFFLRQSNSAYFRDIHDVRIEFDQSQFRTLANEELLRRLSRQLYQYRDSMTERLYYSYLEEWNKLRNWIEDPVTIQKLIEKNEIYRIPALSYNSQLSDSIARKQSDSIRFDAKKFIEVYNQEKAEFDLLSQKKDSLKRKYEESVERFGDIRNSLKAGVTSERSLEILKAKIENYTLRKVEIPSKYSKLMNIREATIGRSQINKSELTAQNLDIKGINFEYNSWYYFSISAGLLDYRFRDFVLQPSHQIKQYMYLLRLGIGSKERNYIIASLVQGQKQLYTSPTISPVHVAALTVEAKTQVSRNTYFIAEVGQSFSKDLHFAPPVQTKSFDLSDRSNKAFSFKWFSYFPNTGSRIEGAYKYTGSNYQSFNFYQGNNTFSSWYIKGEQTLLRRTLKLLVSLRSNDYFNPYIQQNYSSNTIFKTAYLTLRKRKWPTISIGYAPSSQLTKVDNRLIEYKFQSFNGTFNHYYQIGSLRSASTFIYSRFYNTGVDSGFTFFNARNIFFTQNFFVQQVTITAGVSQMKNSVYDLKVLETGLSFPFRSRGTIGFGAKVNNLNKATTKVGAYVSTQVPIGKKDMINISVDHGYLPGRSNNLEKNDFYNLGFSKYFK